MIRKPDAAFWIECAAYWSKHQQWYLEGAADCAAEAQRCHERAREAAQQAGQPPRPQESEPGRQVAAPTERERTP
jgi:hypothetical protein